MFGRKKDQREIVRTFQDGQQVPDQVPDLDIPVYPREEQYQQMPQPVQAECIICLDYGFYADNTGVWYHCPRCNPVKVFVNKGLEAIAKKKEAKK